MGISIISDLKLLHSKKFVDSLHDKLGEVRPKKVKTRWHDKRVLYSYRLFIDKCFKIKYLNTKMTDFDESDLLEYNISIYSSREKRYEPLLRANIDKMDKKKVSVDEYHLGGTSYNTEYIRKVVRNIDTYDIIYTKIGSFEIIEFFDDDERVSMVITQSAIVKLFITFSGKYAYKNLPLSADDDGNWSPKFVLVLSSFATLFGLVYWWFQSLTAFIIILAISLTLLTLSESVNPQQRPLVRVLYIIVYAIVFLFLR